MTLAVFNLGVDSLSSFQCLQTGPHRQRLTMICYKPVTSHPYRISGTTSIYIDGCQLLVQELYTSTKPLEYYETQCNSLTGNSCGYKFDEIVSELASSTSGDFIKSQGVTHILPYQKCACLFCGLSCSLFDKVFMSHVVMLFEDCPC